jgi:hypothetical protein
MNSKIIFVNIFLSLLATYIINASDKTSEPLLVLDPSKSHTFTSETGTYDVMAIIQWASKQPAEHQVRVSTSSLADFLIWDTWSDTGQTSKSNLRQFIDNPTHQLRVKVANLDHPIILTNTNLIIDGVHRLAKAMLEGHEQVKCLFIDQSILIQFRIGEPESKVKSLIADLPIEDLIIKVPKDALPVNEIARNEFLDGYFTDQLPTATNKITHWEVRLERPSTPSGSYIYDSSMRKGLEWWAPGTRVRDIPVAKKILEGGIFALEDQWCPLSWSLFFERMGSIPQELVMLHIDDHQDMMAPRIGKQLNNRFVDYITGDHFSMLKPKTVESAILSGALGKGSILTPLIWQVDKIHVRHLTLRPSPYKTYVLKKALQNDNVLGNSMQRVSVQCENTESNSLLTDSNYIATPNVDDWLSLIPENVPILLHVDMDFFNNRFDGNSSWQETKERRVHDIDLGRQKEILKEIFLGLRKKSLEKRIVDVSICLSPSFFPAEYWEEMTNLLFNECKASGLLQKK